MCTSKKRFTCNEVYNTIQATIACVQKKSKTWILKYKKSDGGLYFDMGFKLDIGKLTINIVELGGEAIKLQSLIENAFNTGLIAYADIDFLPYPPNTIPPKTEFFNLFLGFKAKPASHINYDLVNPIIWHIEYIWCNGDKNLSEYVLKWFAFLVQHPSIIPETILVLRSPSRCGKNIITDFVRKSLFGPELVYSTSDLGKILGKFNSAIQGRKLIIINEAGMASGEWHKANDHLKSLITEDYVSIECKGLEFQECGHYPRFMVLSNHDTPIRVEMGDGRIVCLDVSPRCKSNFTYFDQLGGILKHPDTPGSFMTYLLNLNLSGWKPRKIPPTKMKVETMRNQLSNPIRFIIDHIASWAESSGIRTSSKAFLYQKYLEWCGDNGEKALPNNIFGKKLSEKNITEYKQVRVKGGKREWQYILDRSKIIIKLREHGLGDIEEFSDISQADLPTNEATDIPIFNMPEIIPPKIILPQPDKKAKSPIASTSGTSESSKTSESPEPLIDKPEPSNKKASSTFPARQQREERLRK
ncbi:highly derived D5-like helicase-primase [Rhizophagus clarus]|uniref:Highly derived D5-like helicase-primase n=1 Tax=Rhizophagus clarus TaxID=94130 RepID=A0A8H3LZ91_9GLOM|nr:highly derived D5-like helicase-primase [Rhizophagus clarus]